jgi:periplasmic protein CpxP/Spy
MMKPIHFLATLLLLSLAAASQSAAQDQGGPAPSGEAPDQISRLAEMVGLSDEQESEIRGVIDEKSPKIEQLQQQAQATQAELGALAGPDYDEAAIRAKASELGALQGEMTAESMLLQSEIDSIFTAEQREQLEAMQRQQQQMQQQQMQRQMQQQMQQQMEQQQ